MAAALGRVGGKLKQAAIWAVTELVSPKQSTGLRYFTAMAQVLEKQMRWAYPGRVLSLCT